MFDPQPAQSPDLNVLDLGLFHSLKRMVDQMKVHARTHDQMIEKVKQAYNEYDSSKIENVWACLLGCYNEVLRTAGSNQYKKPHNGCRKQAKLTGSSLKLSVDQDALAVATNALHA